MRNYVCTWKFVSLTICIFNNAKNILKDLAYISLNSIEDKIFAQYFL